MSSFTRTDTSVLGRWWWTVDRWSLVAVISLFGIGMVLAMAASPAVARHHDLPVFFFAQRHALYLLASLLVMLGVSLMTPTGVRRAAVVVLGIALVLTFATLFVGAEAKGATRWLRLGGFSLQPSEFVKGSFPVVAAWMFAAGRLDDEFPGITVSAIMFALITALLMLQPDVGMTVVVAFVWGLQFFLAGMPLALVLVIGVVLVVAAGSSYFVFDHVRSRVDRFLNPESGDTFQIDRAQDAFINGGLFGAGPGEGSVKATLPDAHADFVFAVAGEEFGLLVCLLIVAVYVFIVMRGFSRVFGENNLFVMLAVIGLLSQFAIQALINMGSTLHLIPTKGMTLPFLSYGGSSLLALAFSMGMVLALSRRRPGERS